MKPKHQRLVFVAVSVLFLCLAVIFSLRAFRDNLVFFYSPTDIAEKHPASGQRIRVGGLVKEGSVQKQDNNVRFIITDGAAELEVHYTGILPNLFREGQGVIADGELTDDGHFAAHSILAKHDEKYMPPDVADALKKSGRWKGEQ